MTRIPGRASRSGIQLALIAVLLLAAAMPVMAVNFGSNVNHPCDTTVNSECVANNGIHTVYFGADTLRAAYLGMGLISGSVIVPLALATLATGLVVSLGTKWGLARHWWVLVSLTLTVFATVVLLVETGTIAAYAAVAADPSATEAELRALGSTLVHSLGGMIVLLVVLVLNVYKPVGLTPYGWRKQQTARSRAGSSRTVHS